MPGTMIEFYPISPRNVPLVHGDRDGRSRFMVKEMKGWLIGTFWLFLSVDFCPGIEQEDNKLSIAQRIAAVEAELLPNLAEDGSEEVAAGLIERLRFYRVPGVSISVINDGAIEWARGYGVIDIAGESAVTEKTLFQAASISKPVTALAALRMVEDGSLELEEEVNKFLKSWRIPDNDLTRRSPVTLERILNHTAGLTVGGFRGYAKGEDVPSLEQILNGQDPANSVAIRVEREPGAEARYSGGGFTVLQRLMMDITGDPFPEILQSLVLNPVGMRRSSFEQPLPPGWSDSAARGHGVEGEQVRGGWYTYPEMAAAGLWTNPTDLALFAIEVRRAFRGESKRIISREMARRMLSPQPLSDSYGLGFALFRNRGVVVGFGHDGSNVGYRCAFRIYLESGDGAVIMTNSDTGVALIEEILVRLGAIYGYPGSKALD